MESRTISGVRVVNHPGEQDSVDLRRMFLLHRDPRAIEREMMVELGMEPGSFWREIDDVIVDHFERKRR
jgi:hypothetical protein